MKNKKLWGWSLIAISLLLLTLHAVVKLMASSADWQHWGVLVAVVLILIGAILK